MGVGSGLTDFLASIQNGVSAANNLSQLITTATVNSSSLRVQIVGVSTTTGSTTVGTVTQVNTGIGLTGGPITTTGTIALSVSVFTNSLSSDVALTNTALYFDGPTVAQGSSGVFFASGTVQAFSSNTTVAQAKLWDGTTVMASGEIVILNSQTVAQLCLSGTITNPGGNIRISVKNITSSLALMTANQTLSGKDSTVTAMRVG